MNKATLKIIKNILNTLRFEAMSTDELVGRIEAAENERISNNRKSLVKLDHEKRYKRPSSEDHDKFNC